MKPIQFNPFVPEFRINPYPIYHRLRAENDICSTLGGAWFLTRYEDVKTILKEHRVYSYERPKLISEKNKDLQNKGKNIDALVDTSNKFLFYMNPPDHTRLRRLVSKALLPVVIERMRPQIQTIVNECLEAVQIRGEMDIIADLAEVLPANVIARMLGVSPADAPKRLQQNFQILSRVLDSLISLEEYEAINKGILEFQEYFRVLIAQRSKAPQDDLISYLIAARDKNDQLSEEEVLAICIQLFVAAEETTVNLIGNGMLALLQHPEQMEKLKQNPQIIRTAVEEMLRYDSPIQVISRIAADTLEIGRQTVQKGEKIFLCLGAANRDPSQFSQPDQFDISRAENQHLAFGDGTHRCLGGSLARIQAEIAINSLLQKLPELKLASDKLEWRKNLALRGLKTLPVTFS